MYFYTPKKRRLDSENLCIFTHPETQDIFESSGDLQNSEEEDFGFEYSKIDKLNRSHNAYYVSGVEDNKFDQNVEFPEKSDETKKDEEIFPNTLGLENFW